MGWKMSGRVAGTFAGLHGQVRPRLRTVCAIPGRRAFATKPPGLFSMSRNSGPFARGIIPILDEIAGSAPVAQDAAAERIQSIMGGNLE